MQKMYLSSKNNELNYYHFLYELPWVKIVSLGIAMAMLLSSVSPVFASSNGQGIECGSGAHAEKEQDTAVGKKAEAKGDGATAVGSSSQADRQNSTAVGYYAKALGHGGTAIGTSATTMTGHSSSGTTLDTAIGYIAKYLGGGAAVREDGFFGPRYILSKVSTDGTVERADFNDVGNAFKELDANVRNVNNHLKYLSSNLTEEINKISEKFKHNTLLWNRREKAFVALHTEGKRRENSKLTFLMDGDIASNSTDAITGKQLWETNERVNILKDKVDNMTDAVNTLADEVVTYDKDEQDKKTNTITLVGGKENEPVVIDNVAGGKIEESSEQAINGGQLHNYVQEQMSLVLADANKYADEKIENIVGATFTQANTYTDMKFDALNYKVESVQKEARQAAAIGLAVASLHYINAPGTFSIAFGSGVWRGQSALAFGTGYMSEDRTVCSNFSVTTSGGHWGVGAGLSLALK